MRTFEVQDGVQVNFFSPEEYKTILGGSVEGEFVAAMETRSFLNEDAQASSCRRLGDPLG